MAILIWSKDGIPSYELAVVVDDSAMEISEVVRGEDLLISTARQLLLYEALGATVPKYTPPLLLMKLESAFLKAGSPWPYAN